MNKNYNFRLAEEIVKSSEDDLRDIFQYRSNRYNKLSNILKIFKMKVSINHFNHPHSAHCDISREKLMMFLLNFSLKNQL